VKELQALVRIILTDANQKNTPLNHPAFFRLLNGDIQVGVIVALRDRNILLSGDRTGNAKIAVILGDPLCDSRMLQLIRCPVRLQETMA